MRQTVRIFCAMLALACLVGCAAGPGPATTKSPRPSVSMITEPTTPEETNPQTVISRQLLPETVDNPDGLPVVKWLCLTGYAPSYVPDDTMAQELNSLLAQQDRPYRVQFAVYTSENLEDSWFDCPEVQEDLNTADLIFGSFDCTTASYLQPLSDDLVASFPHDAYRLQVTLNGVLYGIPGKVKYLICNGWSVDNRVFEKCGLTQAEFLHPFWEMDETFAALFEKNGNKPFFVQNEDGYNVGNILQDYKPNVFSSVIDNRFQCVGSCYAIDLTGEKPTVVNYLDTDYTRKTQAALLRYRQAGYVTDKNTPTKWVNYGNVFADFPYVYENMTYIGTEPVAVNRTGFGGDMTGISKNAVNIEAAQAILSLMANDPAFRRQLLFGTTGEAPGANRFLSFLSPYVSVTDSTTGSFEFPVAEGTTRLQSHRQILDRAVLHLPVSLDFSPVQHQTDAVNEVLMGSFAVFSTMSVEDYDAMLGRIRDAGEDEILAELQRQLDAWIAENPNWNS